MEINQEMKKLPFGFGHHLSGKEHDLLAGVISVTTHKQSSTDTSLAKKSLSEKITQAQRRKAI